MILKSMSKHMNAATRSHGFFALDRFRLLNDEAAQ